MCAVGTGPTGFGPPTPRKPPLPFFGFSFSGKSMAGKSKLRRLRYTPIALLSPASTWPCSYTAYVLSGKPDSAATEGTDAGELAGEDLGLAAEGLIGSSNNTRHVNHGGGAG